MEILALTERVRQTIDLGESAFREFKSALEGPPSAKKPRDAKLVARDIAETLVAFANADGGELLVGVEDDGSITGINFSEDTIAKLMNAPVSGVHLQTPLPKSTGRKLTIDGKEILYFYTDKSAASIHQTSDGRCMQRKDLENRPVSIQQVQFERQEQISREYDRVFVDGAKVTDLDIDLLKRVSDATTKMSPEKWLQYFGLAEYGGGTLYLRRAALLLFARDISAWHPRCQVRVIRVKGAALKTGRDYNATSDDPPAANILQLLTAAWEKLRLHLVETKMSPDALFRESIMYPEDACREALINAITHRDYSVEGQAIEIYIYDDRMEVQSPGGLLTTIDLEALRKLQGVHESRNAHIARVLREIGYVREMGEGMRRIFRLMKDADLVPPELNASGRQFTITLRHKSVFSDADQSWLDGFKPLRLTRNEMLVALMGKAGGLLSPQAIYERLDLVDWDVYRSIIDQLIAKGVVRNTISGASKVNKARSKRVSQREIPRIAVRRPEELENGLSELFLKLKEQGPISVLNSKYANEVLSNISVGNPYKSDHAHLYILLELLGMIDDRRAPTSLLINIWGKVPPNDSGTGEKVKRQVNQSEINLQRRPRNELAVKPAVKKMRKAKYDIYIYGLGSEISISELTALFSEFGVVVSARIPQDFVSQKSRGFGFVTMESDEQGKAAIERLNGSEFQGRKIQVQWDLRH